MEKEYYHKNENAGSCKSKKLTGIGISVYETNDINVSNKSFL